MEKFELLRGIAAPLAVINVDTDMIIPKQFLKTIKRTGLGKNLFNELRYGADGAENPDFILNRARYRDARILVTGENFGCGSSREHAPWALMDFGIQCVIAPSYAGIFFNNCFKNGLLPVELPQAEVDKLMADAEVGEEIEIDLQAQHIKRANGEEIPFQIDSFLRHCLLNGLDDISLTLEKALDIDAFEAAQRTRAPWLYA